jgi:hypothetical protein
MEAYGGMQVSPLRLKGDQCYGTTLSQERCKRKASCDSYYCSKHEHLYKIEPPVECPICMDKLGEQTRPTWCGHYMHQECLKQWLGKNATCPVCRTLLREAIVSLDEAHRLMMHSGNNVRVTLRQEVI